MTLAIGFVLALGAAGGIYRYLRASRPPDFQREAEKIALERRRLDETVWAKEVEAQRYETVFIEYWDRARKADDQSVIFADFPFASLILPDEWTASASADQGIRTRRAAGSSQEMGPLEWRGFLDSLKRSGVRVGYSAWHHSTFVPGPPAARSFFSFEIHATGAGERRYLLNGELEVTWSEQAASNGAPLPRSIRVEKLTISERVGKPLFVARYRISPGPGFRGKIDPILVYDLDGDGLPEIIIPAINEIHWNQGGFRFRPAPLSELPLAGVSSGAVADFNRDGHPDILVTLDHRPALLLLGSGDRKFAERALVVPGVQWAKAVSVSAGDVDGDGDVDLWVGQYRLPFDRGGAPTPYYDAMDGDPSYLLLNDRIVAFGAVVVPVFRDATPEMGLGDKRFRRTYSGSLFDHDGDGRLDLTLTSDFSGLEIFTNSGSSRFVEAWPEEARKWKGFGMSHTFADFNGDGRLDLFFAGMSSTTARRLDRLGLGWSEDARIEKMRAPMTVGNLLLLRDQAGGYRLSPSNDQVARAGWAWGTTASDFDNDGDVDLFVANGNISGNTARDYCTTFWRHDVYFEKRWSRPAVDLFWQGDQEVHGLRSGAVSWNPFESNRLFLNDGRGGFVEGANLLGAADSSDGGGAVSTDLNGDGRADLIYSGSHGEAEARIEVLENTARGGSWIGVILRDEPGLSPIGAEVTVSAGAKTFRSRIVVGDSYRSQHPLAAHFGLGAADKADYLEVKWPGGRTRRIESPALNRYHRVSFALTSGV